MSIPHTLRGALPVSPAVRTVAFLTGCLLVMTVLWWPGVRFPVISDTAIYALLGESLWNRGVYAFLGQPHARFLPLHVLFSLPLTQAFGYHLGMHISSLLGGWAVVLSTYFLVRDTVSRSVALWVAVALMFHHGIVYMTMVGSADLLFTALWTCSLWMYVKAGQKPQWYIGVGTLVGMACLTRYNALAAVPFFFLWTVWSRRSDLRSPWFWSGLVLAGAVFAPWLLRNWWLFGHPMHTEYSAELAEKSPSMLLTVLANARYYLQPQQNILPILFLASLWGMWRHRRSQAFLLWSLPAAWLFTAIWWVKGMRFAVAGFPVLLTFAVLGMQDVWSRSGPTARRWLGPLLIAALIGTHGAALCLYNYGACNAWVDRSIGVLPADLRISSEGYYANWIALQELNRLAETGAAVGVHYLWDAVMAEGVYRSDLRVYDEADPLLPCRHYAITQAPTASDEVLFRTSMAPYAAVVQRDCAR